MRKPDLTTSDSAVTTWGLALLWPDLAGFGRSILTVASETTLPLTATAAIALALLVVWFAPAERKQVRRALALFGVSLAMLFLSVVFLAGGHPRAYSFTRGLATLIQGIALINLASGF